MGNPPRMNDMAELAKVAIEVPIETQARLELLRRELAAAIKDDPQRVAELAYKLEEIRSQLCRQVQHALLMLAERATQVDLLEMELQRLEQQQRRRWWLW